MSKVKVMCVNAIIAEVYICGVETDLSVECGPLEMFHAAHGRKRLPTPDVECTGLTRDPPGPALVKDGLSPSIPQMI